MKVDHPQAYRFILQDELYLLHADKTGILAHAAEPAIQSVPVEIPAENAGQQPASAREDAASPVISTPAIKLPVPVLKTPEPAFNYLGGNNKNFVILLNYADEQFIPAPHLTALESILKRKGLELPDVAIVNIHTYAPVTLAKIAAAFSPVKLLIMGKEALPQGIGNLPLNQPVQGKKTNVLYSFSFAEMISSNDNKKAFWDQMKTL